MLYSFIRFAATSYREQSVPTSMRCRLLFPSREKSGVNNNEKSRRPLLEARLSECMSFIKFLPFEQK
jgi:hypothetical protein